MANLSNIIDFITPNDDDARAAALDTRASCIVEAPAGSGKTGLLVQRYLKLLGDPSVAAPEEILAITFTNKATAELRERVLSALSLAVEATLTPHLPPFDLQTRTFAAAALARSAQLGWNLVTQPQRLNIRSIDSVCAEIANGLPLLSGGGGPRQPLEDARPLYRLAARRTLLQLGGSDQALHNALRDVLLHRDASLADCETLLADMLETREQWGELVPLGPTELDAATLAQVRLQLERSLESIVCSGLSRALNAMPPGVLEHLTAFAHRHAHLPGHNDKDSPIALCADKHLPPEAVAEHLDHWTALISLVLKPSDGGWRKSLAVNTFGFKPSKAELDDFKAFIASIESDSLREALHAVLALPPAKYPDDQWRVAESLFHVLRHALAELKLLFASRGECDFAEFALAARQALTLEDSADDSATALALSSGGRIQHLLVDEMQDTSSGQYDLIQLLTRSWDGATQTLFLVGDPKQSIYLFRQARVERFLRTMREQRLGDIHLKSLYLTSNFRSQATLVQDFNHVFSQIFPQPSDPSLHGSSAVDVPFIAAHPVRPPTTLNALVWHPTLLRSDDPTPYRESEALQIRYLIESSLASADPAKHLRIAILARARTHLTSIVAEFKRDHGHGPICYRAVDIDALDELPEVLDALALTRALLHPADRTAWLAVLHSPACGLGLADLLALTSEVVEADRTAPLASLIPRRRHLLSSTGQQLLKRAWPILSEAATTLGRATLAVQVERTWCSLGLDTAYTAAQRTHVLRYLNILSQLESESDRIDLAVLISRIKKLYAEPAPSLPNAPVTIELLTIHKAKGLEWDIVIAPGLERAPRRPTPSFLNWIELDSANPKEDATIILAPIWGKNRDSDNLNQWLKNVRASRDRAEEKRLAYVASTRAREELHLFAALAVDDNEKLANPRYDSLLRALWPAAAPHFSSISTPSECTNAPVEIPRRKQSSLSLAASATSAGPPHILRLPLDIDLSKQFLNADLHRLKYTPSSALPLSPSFDRPEGGFAVRAFGNAVHTYLQMISTLLESNTPELLLKQLPNWIPRLTTTLRSEGIPPALASSEAARALRALTNALSDPVGLWAISPHLAGSSEYSLTTPTATLRVDRTFIAGTSPISTGHSTIWIIDFKTTEQGSRTDKDFAATELAHYTPQLQAYAALRRTLPDGHLPIQLGLYYPLVPRLLHFPSSGNQD